MWRTGVVVMAIVLAGVFAWHGRSAEPSSNKSLLRKLEPRLSASDRRLRVLPERTLDSAAGLATAQATIANCLMITELKVVNDARASGDGAWSFGHLLKAAANQRSTGIRVAELTRRWVAHWEQDQSLNGSVVRKREGIQQFLDDWPKTASGDLDLDRAPFRLLAIVNRLDLRNNLVLGVPRIGGGNGGEARLVYGAIDPQGRPLPFTVIFEYGIKRQTFAEVQAWARRWYELKELKLGSEAYLQRLQGITDEFTAAAADPEQLPNGSALQQIRTNEIALGNIWELREFRLSTQDTGYLKQVTIKQTPQLRYQGTETLQRFLEDNRNEILNKQHTVPVEYPAGTPFLAGGILMQRFFKWQLPDGAPPELEPVRQLFAIHTCNGCHLAETGTEFTHVGPRAKDAAAELSRFLTEVDLVNREQDLRSLVEQGAEYEKKRPPLQFVH